MAGDLVERLRDCSGNADPSGNGLSALLSKAADALSDLLVAVEPFVRTSEYIRSPTTPDDGLCVAMSFTAGDFRRLAQVVASIKPLVEG